MGFQFLCNLEWFLQIQSHISAAVNSQSLCTNDLPVEHSSNISDEAVTSDELQLQSIDQASSTFGEDMHSDIAIAVLRALAITDEIGGSQKKHATNCTNLDFGRKGNQEMSKSWPNSWSSCTKILKKQDTRSQKPIIFA